MWQPGHCLPNNQACTQLLLTPVQTSSQSRSLEQLMQDDSVRRLINQLHANNGKMLSVCHTQINLTDADAVSHRIYHMAPHCVIA